MKQLLVFIGFLVSILACAPANDESENNLSSSDKSGENPLPNTLVKVTDESPGTNCETGGKKIEAGGDLNADGSLSEDEIEQIIFACNGKDGADGKDGEKGEKGDAGTQGEKGDKGEQGETGDQGLAGEKGNPGPKGEKGEKGAPGAKGEKGDAGEDGDDCEVISTSIDSVTGNTLVDIKCGTQNTKLEISKGEKGESGEDGAKGDTGAKGKNSLIKITAEPAGINCSYGGNKIETGLDDNDDNILGDLEVDSVAYICNGYECLSDQHFEAGSCVSNTRSCSVTNGTGIESWDFSAAAWGECKEIRCNTDYSLRDNDQVCVITKLDCSDEIENSKLAYKTFDTFYYGDCELISCVTGYSVDAGLCKADNSSGGGSGSVYSDLIISEYVEGSSFNKAIEIFNGTGSDIDLSEYTIVRRNNGQSEDNISFNTGTILKNGETYVLCSSNSTIDSVLKSYCDLESSKIAHNGNDGYRLSKFDTNGSETVIDSIGNENDPGSAWESADSAGLTISTKDKTLRRKCSVTSGDIDFSDTFEPHLEWEQFDKDSFDDVGQYICP